MTIAPWRKNFIACDREQELLLPPSLRDWLPEGHLAWFVIDAVAEMDLSGFYAAYRNDGHGRAAHDPAMMVALLLYAYAVGRRSSRVIERAGVDDAAVRVIAANQRPDHTTIARFRQRHEAALGGLFGDVLALCAEAGLVGVAVLAVDGTKLHANASQHQNLDYDQIAREILAEADAADPAEDERFGDGRGDELTPELVTAQGRRGWLRDAKRRLDERRTAEAKRIPKSRPERLREGKRRLEEEHEVHCQANEAYEAAEINTDSPDFGHLEPMVTAAERELTAAGVAEAPVVVVADAGYWHHDQLDNLAGRGIQELIPPDAGKRKGARPGCRTPSSTDASIASYAAAEPPAGPNGG